MPASAGQSNGAVPVDAAAFASKVRNAVESMQRGRSLTTLSEHTRVVTHQAIQNSIP